MRARKISVWMVLVLVGGLTACSSLRRNPIPLNQMDRATIEGFPGIRAWHDEFNQELQDDFIAAERKRRTFKKEERASVLVLSGGGHNGAFGAGFLKGWSASGQRPEFNLVTGISTGALMAPFAFLGSKWDHDLEENYTQTTGKDVYSQKGILSAVYDESMLDTFPMRKQLNKLVNQETFAAIAKGYEEGRRLLIATTHMDAQRLVIWNMGKIAQSKHPQARKLFIDIMIASASIPGAFPPVYFKVKVGNEMYDEMHVDGGMVAQSFLYGATMSVFESRKKGVLRIERKKRPVVYVIRNWKVDPEPMQVDRSITAISLRAIETLLRSSAAGDLYRIYSICDRDDMGFQYVSIPQEHEPVSLEPFDQAEMKKLFALGYEQGKGQKAWKKTPPGLWDRHQKSAH